MALQNSLASRSDKPRFSVAIQSEGYKKLINNTLGDPKVAQRFVTAITSAVSVNPALQECDASTILSAAFLGEGLNLSPSPQLGQYYLVPFKDKKNSRTVATFVLGYKGYVQLAIRSGYYKKINVLELREGELVKFDLMTEDIEVRIMEDDLEREKLPIIGYYAMFEYHNGFRKAMYWSQAKMEVHADTYSPAFSLKMYHKLMAGEIPREDLWKYSSFWYKSFPDMAKKTLLRQIISKWGIMSIELQKAYESDETFGFTERESREYVTEYDTVAEVVEETVSEAAEPEKPKGGRGKAKEKNESDPFAGTPFEEAGEEQIPDFVAEVERGQE